MTPAVKVAILGPGRVGTALALALPPDRYEVVAVAGRGDDAVARFVARFPAARPLPASSAARAASLVIVAVQDDVLAGLVREVARSDGVAGGSRWVHVAGGRGLDVLRPVRLAGAAIAACHPAQTFPDPDRGRAALPGTAWAVTAAESDLPWARTFVGDLGGVAVEVPERSRRLYHTALTVGSNATVSVVALARELLFGAGIADPEPFLRPLVLASASNAVEHGAAALTGPVRRGDAEVVAGQLDELATVLPEAVEAYVAFARLALRHARRGGLDAGRAEAVAVVLDRAAAGPERRTHEDAANGQEA